MMRDGRRLGAVLLSAMLSLSLLAGCGASGGEEAGETAEVPEKSPVQAETVQEERAEPPAPAALPVVGITLYADYNFDAPIGNRYELSMPGVDAATREAYPALAAALDQYREDTQDSALVSFQERNELIDEILSEGGDETLNFYGEERDYIRRADAQAFSALLSVTEYAGGVHEMYGYASLNLDTATGEPITLDSLLSDAGREQLNSRVGAELDRLYPDLAPGGMVEAWSLDEYTFTLEPDGVTFWFSPYEIASFADGAQAAKLYFDRDSDLFNGRYDASDSWWSMEFENSVPCLFSPDGGVTTRTVEVWGESSVEEDYIESIRVELDGPVDADRWDARLGGGGGDRTIYTEDLYAYAIRPYYCHTPAGDFLMVLSSSDNDVENINLYYLGESVQNFTARAPQYMTGPTRFQYPAPPENPDDWIAIDSYTYRTALTNPMSMPLTTRFDWFGTWNAEGEYMFVPGGIELNGESLWIPYARPLTLLMDLIVRPVSGDNLFYEYEDDVTIPAGTEVTMFATDGMGTVFFRVEEPVEGLPTELSDGPWQFGLANDNPDEWPRTVGGVEESALFDGLMYAG